MRRSQEAEYRQYVTDRMDQWRRVAYLLCHDWHTADDLVSITIGKLYRHWHRVGQQRELDAYVRKILLRTWLDERRRPWRREEPTEVLPDLPSDSGNGAVGGIVDRAQLVGMLAGLAPRQRAAVVLRLYCDLSVAETAEVLGCTAGTVKSQTARGLDTLRLRVATETSGYER